MRISKLLIILSSLALVGAGCFGIGGSSTTTAADGGVFKSLDAGSTWTAASAILSSKGVGSIAATDVLTLEFDPQDNAVVYAGTRAHGVLMSTDSAATWSQPRNGGMKEGKISAIEVDPTDVCTVYVAKGSRLYKTSDCARSFDSEAYVETRTGVTIKDVAVDWYAPMTVWIGLSNGDVLKSEDGAKTWRTSVMTKESVTGIMVNNGDSRVLLVATNGKAFFKTTDAGETWTQIDDSLKDFKKADKVAAMTQDSTGNVVIAATGYGLLRSRDFGTTWEGIQLLSAPGQVTISAVDVDPRNGETIVYAAGTTFYRSTDGGVTWTTAKSPSARVPMAMEVDPTDANVVYLGVAAVEK